MKPRRLLKPGRGNLWQESLGPVSWDHWTPMHFWLVQLSFKVNDATPAWIKVAEESIQPYTGSCPQQFQAWAQSSYEEAKLALAVLKAATAGW